MYTCVLLAASLLPTQADDSATLAESVAGYWEGALVRGRSIQTLSVEFEKGEDGSLFADVELPEWIWWPAPDSDVEVKDGGLELRLVYGRARLELDRGRDEILGTLGAGARSMHVHLKRAIRPARLRIIEEEFTVESNGITIAATLHLPPWDGPHPAVVQAWSRGPHERWEGDRRIGRMFAERGVAFCTYDKRGCGATGGDLETARFGDLVADLGAVVSRVASDERIDAGQVGLHAESAGGWVATRVAAGGVNDIAFVATYEAPATPVRQQQREAVDGWMAKRGFGAEPRAAARRYVDLLSEGSDWAAVAELREEAERDGWGELLEGDPATADELAVSWVVRHDYDPTADLARLDVPWLAHFGAIDWVVPPESNAAALRAAGLEDLTVVVLEDIDHGMIEWPSATRVPDGDELRAYFLFNKLLANMWQRELDWIGAHVVLSESSPLQR